MSVRKNARNISSREYEHTFEDLYHYSSQRTMAIAKRRKKWIGNPIDESMNILYNSIMEMSEGYFPDKEEKVNLVRRTLFRLAKLEKPLMILWNVEKYSTKRMVRWSTLINNTVDLLNRQLSEENKVNMKVMIIDWNVINSAKFLSNMSHLHRYVHGKVIHTPNRYDQNEGSVLIKLVDDAFYCLIDANKHIPRNNKEYQDRRKNISKAISCLYKMQRQTIFYFNLMGYSETIMREWSNMITNELKMLHALNKSDKERFSDLLEE